MIGDAQAVDPLITTVSRMKTTVIKVLSQMVLFPLIRLLLHLNEGDAEMRQARVEILGKLGDRRAVEPLIGILNDPQAAVRDAAIEFLRKLGDRRAIEPLIAILEANKPYLPLVVIVALQELGWELPLEAQIALLRSDHKAAREALQALGKMRYPCAVELLAEMLKGDNLTASARAAKALGIIGGPAVMILVNNLLTSYETSDRRVVDEDEWGKMYETITYTHYRASRVIIEALGETGDERAIGPLIDAYGKHPSPDIRKDVLTALKKIGPLAVVPLIPYLDTGDHFISTLVAEALSEIRDSGRSSR